MSSGNENITRSSRNHVGNTAHATPHNGPRGRVNA
jgi:hypothetical protein